ncbi:MAG: c-type cytochrome [Rhodothermales bacterium]
MKKILKWIGLVVGGLIVFLAVVVLFLSSKGQKVLDQQHEISAALLSEVRTDSARIARGRHIAMTTGCFDCHGEQLEGRVFVDAPPFLVPAGNLTSGAGGTGSSYTIEDWDRAIRYGVTPSGKSVVIMPSKTYHNLSDEDAESLISFLMAQPAVDNVLPEREFRLLGRLLTGAGAFDPTESVHLTANRKTKPEEGPTAEYGAYVASLTCTYCHGEDLRGGPPIDPGSPVPVDLVPSGAWSFDDFSSTLRTGVTPYGKEMNPDHMPWTFTKNMTNDELLALYAHLQEIGV